MSEVESVPMDISASMPSLVDIYTAHIQSCLLNAKQSISQVSSDIMTMDGSAGIQTKHLYNNLLGMSDARYLEVGMGDLSTLCAAMMGNTAKIVSIGNAGLQDPSAMMVLDSYKGGNSLSVSSKKLAQVNVNVLPKSNIVCEGGMTSVLSTIGACLDDVFVYVTGDWNDTGKQSQVRGTISEMGWTLLYEKEIFTPGDGFPTWWNGIFIGIVSKLV